MAGPDPIVIDFHVKNLDEVKGALKSIADAVTKTEQKSAAAAKLRASESEKASQKQVQSAAKAVAQTQSLLQASERAGTQRLSSELRTRLQNQTRHLRAEFEANQKFERNKQAIRERSASMAGKFAAKQAADEMRAAREVEGYRIKHANKHASEAAKAARQLALEEKRARLSMLKGDEVAKIGLSPQARLQALRDAKGKSPAEQRAAVEKVRDMADENRALVARRKKGLADFKDAEAEKSRAVAAEERHRTEIIQQEEKRRADIAKQRAKAEQQNREQFGRTVTDIGGRAVRNATTITGSVLRGVANVGGGFSVEDSVQREVAFRGRAASIAATTNEKVTQNDLMESARSMGISQGIDPEEVLRGYEEVKKLNDKALPQALRVMPDLGKIATVTGTDMGDLGQLAANITASHADKTYVDENGKTQKGISDKDLKRQLRIFARQGIEGGVEISDFAKYGARITAGAGLFTGDLGETEATLGMGAQLARQKGGAASAAEATLASQRMATDLQKKAGHLKELGIDVNANDGSGKMRAMDDIIVDMLKKQSTVTGISEFKISERGNRVLTGAADVFREAGGGEAGAKAVKDYFARGRKDISEKDVEDRFKKRMTSEDKQLQIAMTKLRVEVGTHLVPALIPLVQQVTKLMPAFQSLLTFVGQFADFAANNPLAGLGAILGAAVAKEVLASGLKMGLQALATSLGSAGLSIASAAAAAAEATAMLVAHLAEEDKKVVDQSANADIAAANAMPLLKRGIHSKEELAEAEQVKASLEQSIAAREGSVGGNKYLHGLAKVGATAGDIATAGMFGLNDKVDEAHASRTATDQREIEEQRKTLAEFTKLLAQTNKAILAAQPQGPALPGPANPASPSRGLPMSKR